MKEEIEMNEVDNSWFPKARFGLFLHKPILVGQFEFLEWTGENHLRHSGFIALREDKNPRDVVRENHRTPVED
jgi:ATP-dependent DNA ligase